MPVHHGLPQDPRAVLEEGRHAAGRALGRGARERRRARRRAGANQPLEPSAECARRRAHRDRLGHDFRARLSRRCDTARVLDVAQRAARHPAASRTAASRDALATLLGDWRDERAPRIACGMIGSRQGWVEAPYVACPASLADARPQARPHAGGRACRRAGRADARRRRRSRRDARRGDAARRRGRCTRGTRAGRAARHAQQMGARRARAHRRFRDVHDRRDLERPARRTASSAAWPRRRPTDGIGPAFARGVARGLGAWQPARTTSSARARWR